jgi:HEAT repeat protein
MIAGTIVRRPALALLLGACVIVTALDASARPPEPTAIRTPESPDDDEPRSRSLRARVALEPLAQALDSPGTERRRAIERLSSIGTQAAVRVLVEALEHSPPDAADDWLAFARALAPHARSAGGRHWLSRILSQTSRVAKDDAPGIQRLIQATAAVALARAGDKQSLKRLGSALRQSESSAALAQTALLAHPPRTLTQLLNAPGPASLTLIDTLEALGDQRAFHPLREWVKRGAPELSARAALALFRMGHLETVALAEHWLEHAPNQPKLLEAATEILLAVDHQRSPAALARHLALDPERALNLARQFPLTRIADTLVAAVADVTPQQKLTALSALGATGAQSALPRLEQALTDPAEADTAAYALARFPGPEATDTLLRQLHSLREGRAQLRIARALVVRQWFTGESIPVLTRKLNELSKSKDKAQRWVGIWGLSVAANHRLSHHLLSDDWVDVGAAAATLLIQPDALAVTAARRYASELSQPLRRALAPSLSLRSAALTVAGTSLHRLLGESPSLALVLAPALTARVEEQRPAAVQALLQSEDVLVRAAALRGRGTHPLPSALGELERAYRSETDPLVRLAALEGISARPDGGKRTRLLDWARNFDPDPKIRRAASLNRVSALPAVVGNQSVWLELTGAEPGEQVVLTTSSGAAYATVVPPDRVLIVLGFAPGEVRVRWTTPEAPPSQTPSSQTPPL